MCTSHRTKGGLAGWWLRHIYFISSAAPCSRSCRAMYLLIELFERPAPTTRPPRNQIPKAFAVLSFRTSTWQSSFHIAVIYFWHSFSASVVSEPTLGVFRDRLFMLICLRWRAKHCNTASFCGGLSLGCSCNFNFIFLFLFLFSSFFVLFWCNARNVILQKGKNFGLKFIPNQSNLFGFIPKSASVLDWTHSS